MRQSKQNPFNFKLSGGLFFLVLLTFGLTIVYCTREVLTPFLIGWVFSYFLQPTTNYINRGLGNTTLSSLLMVTVVTGLLFYLAIILFPLMYAQLLLLYEKSTKLNTEDFHHWIHRWPLLTSFPTYVRRFIEDTLLTLPGNVSGLLSNIIKPIFQSTLTIVHIIIILVFAPFTTFYLLRDQENISRALWGVVPQTYRSSIRWCLHNISDLFLKFLEAQFYISIVLSVFYTACILFCKLDSPITLGLISGFLSFIPYLGCLVRALLLILLSFLQFGTWSESTVIIAFCSIGLLIEMLILNPVFMGSKLGLHPLLTVIGLFVGISLLGPIGMFLALPLTVFIVTLTKIFTNKYETSNEHK